MPSENQMAPRLAYRREQDSRRSIIGRLEPYALIAPALGILALFFFFPALYNFFLSLRDLSLFQLDSGGRYVGLDNFAELLRDPDSGLVLVNTVFWLTAVTVVLRLVLGTGFALILNSDVLKRWNLSGIATTLMLIPWMLAPVVTVAVWQWLLHPRYGAINQVLLDAGLIDRGIPFLVNTSTVWWAVIVMFVWREVPFTTISILAGLQSIPHDLYEAAKIDGASGIQAFFGLTLPLLRPVLVVVTLLTTIWTFNNFVFVWLATRGGPGNYTQVMATQVFNEAFVNYRLGYGAAIGVVMSVMMMLFSIVYFLTVFRKSVAQA